jgi:hypothetical protein
VFFGGDKRDRTADLLNAIPEAKNNQIKKLQIQNDIKDILLDVQLFYCKIFKYFFYFCANSTQTKIARF